MKGERPSGSPRAATESLVLSQLAAGRKSMLGIFLKELPSYLRLLLLVSICTLLLETAGAAQDLQPGETFRDCPQCPEMVVIPSGTFQMGSSPSDYQRDLLFRPPENFVNTLMVWLGFPGTRGFPDAELPQHTVTIKQSFAMSKYPVTVAEFVSFVEETGYSPRGHCLIFNSGKPHISSGTSWRSNGFKQVGDDPVVCMRPDDARAYTNWLNRRTGHDPKSPVPDSYRLPSESEWEYAARAGTTTAWWWGDQVGRGNTNCDGCDPSRDPRQPTPVGTYRANPFGLYDMLGNVLQMVRDCWNPNYNDAPDDGSPWLSGDCSKVVLRGGSYNNVAWFARSANRSWLDVKSTDNLQGFRVVRNMTTKQ